MHSLRHLKEQKYDRQLRLWGDRGQEALGKSRVCVIGSSAVGSELLKNLVLPGIGGFTIVDNAIVTKSDLGSNFFVAVGDLGKSRAEVVAQRLSEMNTEVCGDYVVESIESIIEGDPNFFLNFDAIIYADIREGPLLRISSIVSEARIPIIACVSVGFIGFLRVSVLEHAIIESHPDSTKSDFRLDNPPSAFVKLVNEPENDLDSLPATHLAQVPWLIIVYKFVLRFQQQTGRFPADYKDKMEIRRVINAAAESLMEKFRSQGEVLESSFELTNFVEAAKAVITAVGETRIPPEVEEIFNDDRCRWSPESPEEKSMRERGKTESPLVKLSMTTFWRLANGLKEFTMNEGGGSLPLRGDLPDMTSSSKRYLKLLSAYRESAEEAVGQLASRLSQIEGLSLDDVKLVARNAAYLRVIKCRSLEEELKQSPARSGDLHLLPSHEENDAMLWYFVLRGAASFFSEVGRWPGSPSGSPACSHLDEGPGGGAGEQNKQFSPLVVELDMPVLRAHVGRVLMASGVAANAVSVDYVHEMCKFGGGEVHSVAAFMGGIAAQEVIKLLTHQFVPVHQPLIYNAVRQRVCLLEF